MAPNNPDGNCLSKGVSVDAVQAAIDKSGCPLQTVLGNLLRDDFAVQDEWSFLDRDTKELRAIDLHAGKELFDRTRLNESPRVRPSINLLVECKQSELPYVFFLSPKPYWTPEFPLISGLSPNPPKG